MPGDAEGLSTLPADYVKSRKHEWDEACYVPDVHDVKSLHRTVRRMVELQEHAVQPQTLVEPTPSARAQHLRGLPHQRQGDPLARAAVPLRVDAAALRNESEHHVHVRIETRGVELLGGVPVARIVTGDDRQHFRAIAGGLRDDADLIESRCEGHQPPAAHASVGRLQPYDTAEGRGLTHRATRVFAERAGAQSGSGRDA